MNLTRKSKLLSCILCAVLAWTAAFGITGCTDNTPEAPKGNKTAATTAEPPESSETSAVSAEEENDGIKRVGEGDTSFTLTVTDGNGKDTVFEIATDSTTVGEALMELGLIEGEEGPYGLYIKRVNGITADYDKDGTYWAFYIDGEYAMSGVDTTNIEDGHEYSLKVEK